jgi:hypothetical protein
MSLQLDARIAGTGTRFLLFPQPRFLMKADGSGPLFAKRWSPSRCHLTSSRPGPKTTACTSSTR